MLIAKASGGNPITRSGESIPAQARTRRRRTARPDDDAIASLVEEVEPVVEEATPVVETRPVSQTRKVETVAAGHGGRRGDRTDPQQPYANRHGRSRQHGIGGRPAGQSRSPLRQNSPKPRLFLDETSKQAPSVLADAVGFTVAFEKDGVTYYRARFGFGSKTAASKACNALKKKKIECYAVHQ